ncbi:flagellin [Caloramator sp. ALD01]|uniref:Flagellin C-terminal helical region n=1 Tax=Caloramator proteoclasticus DSM 10124 TaxID=1121262 RepID=A0A1M5BZ55_9CLOT|nr:flagellin C-terminal helical region [Caloramator proteoclasticus DSM 10124]
MSFELKSNTADTTITVNGSITTQIGANEDQTMSISLNAMASNNLGIDKLDVTSYNGASDAITKINDAIISVSQEREKLGAYQNRLEHTIANLGTSSENLTAAESRIRDVDMAKEMMQFSKKNILTQASQAMLAQANQIPQGVLQILR